MIEMLHMIKSRITLKQLEAFAYVVDSGTFRAAAAALGTTQPNISARITALETALKVTLLIRDAGSVRLTADGDKLLAKTRDVLRAGEALIEEAGRQDLIEETMRLGVTELVACTWLQSFLRLMKEAYPNLRIQLEVDISTAIDARLMEGKLDLALHTGPFKSKAFAGEALGQETYCWVVNSDLI
jgi:DNA-binding transcriptional LysR family regulator